jgi:biopolymer transport protein ExbD
MARAVRIADPVPFSAINVTPFIDVLLVLLIVLILGLPLATHKVSVDLPTGTGAAPLERPHKLAIDADGRLFWDGRAIPDAELPPLLAATRTETGAVLHLQTDAEARYERFDSVLAVVKRGGIERLGFIGHRPLAD